jgi:hypothetical protein
MNWSLVVAIGLIGLMVTACLATILSSGKERLVPKRRVRVGGAPRSKVGARVAPRISH